MRGREWKQRTTVIRSDVKLSRETSVSQQPSVPNWGHPLKPLGPSQHYRIEGLISWRPLGRETPVFPRAECIFFTEPSKWNLGRIIRRLSAIRVYCWPEEMRAVESLASLGIINQSLNQIYAQRIYQIYIYQIFNISNCIFELSFECFCIKPNLDCDHTLFRLIWHQMKFHLVPIQSENCSYKPNLVWFNKISENIWLCLAGLRKNLPERFTAELQRSSNHKTQNCL